MKLPRLVCTLALALFALAASSSATAETYPLATGTRCGYTAQNVLTCFVQIPALNSSIFFGFNNQAFGGIKASPVTAYNSYVAGQPTKLYAVDYYPTYSGTLSPPQINSFTCTQSPVTGGCDNSSTLSLSYADLVNNTEVAVTLQQQLQMTHCGGKGTQSCAVWFWIVVDGTYTTGLTANETSNFTSKPLPGRPIAPTPEIGTVYILECYGSGWLPTYTPTGRVGAQGIQVGAQCIAYNTETGTYGTLDSYTWWIPWSTWFFPPAQIPACEVANYSSWCASELDNPEIQLSTPQHPAL